MKQGLPITFLAVFGIMALIPTVGMAESVADTNGAPILAAEKRAPAAGRASMGNSLATVSMGPGRNARSAERNVRAAQGEGDFSIDHLIRTSLYKTGTSGGRKRNLEFSGRTGPKLRIGLKRKKVRFALNFKLIEDVFFAPAYRLAISRADFQNPNGYWAHSLFVGMRFKFESGAQ